MYLYLLIKWLLNNGSMLRTNTKQSVVKVIHLNLAGPCVICLCMCSQSELVNQSIYCCDWLCLSPRFRRQILVMMQFCVRPLAPRTAYIIPMSLDTYIQVMSNLHQKVLVGERCLCSNDDDTFFTGA